jgi:hypothetical protein
MQTTTKEKATVTVEHSDWDYSHFYDLAAVNEESALAVAKGAVENDLRPREIWSVTIEVWESRQQVAKFHFDREELRGE